MKIKKTIAAMLVLLSVLGTSACSTSGETTGTPSTAVHEDFDAFAGTADDGGYLNTYTDKGDSPDTAAEKGADRKDEPATAAEPEKGMTAEAEKGMAADAEKGGEADTRAADDKELKTEAADTVDLTDGAIDTVREADDKAEMTDRGELPETPIKDDNGDTPGIGLLTAGEWNDNDNYGFLTNLVKSNAISFPSFGLNPLHRTVVTVTGSDKKPLMNAQVSLLDSEGASIYKALTNKNGIAYLFAEDPDSAASVEVRCNGKSKTYPVEHNAESVKTQNNQNTSQSDVRNSQEIQNYSSESMNIIFDESSKAYKKTDIMFIVDSTGSMSDEMLFLQYEFSGIAKEVIDENTRFSVNFYRDEGDEYVTKCNDFTSDINKVQTILNSERADGGGDYPEAVDKILSETISKTNWAEDSVKIAFMIFDAPPHNNVEEKLKEAIAEASRKGIRIVPVVSSNSERDTELFARAAAMMTGGTYVFLTDDSGIGDSHLEPIIGDYKVEKLYDIIIRIIKESKQ